MQSLLARKASWLKTLRRHRCSSCWKELPSLAVGNSGDLGEGELKLSNFEDEHCRAWERVALSLEERPRVTWHWISEAELSPLERESRKQMWWENTVTGFNSTARLLWRAWRGTGWTPQQAGSDRQWEVLSSSFSGFCSTTVYWESPERSLLTKLKPSSWNSSLSDSKCHTETWVRQSWPLTASPATMLCGIPAPSNISLFLSVLLCLVLSLKQYTLL